jgi:hypothetical protein
MTQEELIQFLKENLKIEVSVNECCEISIRLDDEIISTDFFTV